MTASGPESSRRGGLRPDDRTTVVRLDDERRLAYAEYGCPDGTPVVFLHGTPGSRRLGAVFETSARVHGVRVLAPDRPGYGRSTPWLDRSLADAATVVEAVLDDAGVERAGLVAFSGGAPHALATASVCPDRLTRVDIVAGATPPSVTETTPAVQRLLALGATTVPTVLRGVFRGQAWLAARLAPSVVVSLYTSNGRAERVPADVAELVRADFVEALRRGGWGAVTEFRQTATDWDVACDEVPVDVCFWHGTADTNVPIAGVRRFADRMPTAELRVVDGADHLRTLLRRAPTVLLRHR